MTTASGNNAVIEIVTKGPKGDAGIGLPAGGVTGQILSKASNDDYDGEWITVSGTGTVTSVDLDAPAGFAVAGGPITTTGTITLSYAAGYQGYTSAEASKLAGIADGAEVNVNADWDATGGDAEILNKPTLGTAAALDVGTGAGTVAAGAHKTTHATGGTDALTPADIGAATSAQGSLADSAVQPGDLATVATSGAYADLSGTPGLVSTSTAGLRAATSFSTITYAAQVALDFAALDSQYRTISLTGDLELTTSNLANGRTLVLRLAADATERTFTFPADWVFIGTKPSTIAASKTAVLSLTAFGTANTDVVAAYAVQS